MVRMDTDALRQKVALAIYEDEYTGLGPWSAASNEDKHGCYIAANAALIALGLDDLEAAVERGAKRLGLLLIEDHKGGPNIRFDAASVATHDVVRYVLEAALCATEGTDFFKDLHNARVAAEARVAALEAAVENYLLWRPGEKGHAAAHRELQAALKGDGRCPDCGRGPVSAPSESTTWATKDCYEAGHSPVTKGDGANRRSAGMTEQRLVAESVGARLVGCDGVVWIEGDGWTTEPGWIGPLKKWKARRWARLHGFRLIESKSDEEVRGS